jgi:hypothetical protein
MPTRKTREIHDYAAQEIRAELGRQRLKVAYLGPRIGWTDKQVRSRLTGEVEMTAGEMHAFAEVLGIPLSQLFPPGLLERRPAELRRTG